MSKKYPRKIFSQPFLRGAAIFGVCLICCGIAGWVYTYRIDHRTAPSLSAYCDIDFKSARDEKGRIASATLTLLDYRYSNTPLKPQLRLYIDGVAWDIDGTAKQLPPVYALQSYDARTAFKNTNKLFVEFPPEALPEIKAAKEIRVQLTAEGSKPIDLPLNGPDRDYWQTQIQ